MKKEFYTTGIYNTNRSTYGGVIYNGDFDEYHSINDIASRIISDWSFDKQCKKNIEVRNKQTAYKEEAQKTTI